MTIICDRCSRRTTPLENDLCHDCRVELGLLDPSCDHCGYEVHLDSNGYWVGLDKSSDCTGRFGG